MIQGIIIEDEQRAALLLEKMLSELELPIEILCVANDLPSGVICIKKHKPDLVFLDIEMPGYSGLQLFEFIEEHEIDFEIIFTTAYNDYAINAFEMNAVDYLLKPILPGKLERAVEKVMNKRQNSSSNYSSLKNYLQQGRNTHKIIIPVGNGMEVINTEEIIYLKAQGSYTNIFFAGNKKLLVSKKIKYFEQLLHDFPSFFRIHRSYMVNLNVVKKILKTNGGTIVLNDDTELPVSINKIEQFIDHIEK